MRIRLQPVALYVALLLAPTQATLSDPMQVGSLDTEIALSGLNCP